MKQLKNDLLELGFSENDANVYLALAHHGPCNAGPVIKATNLHRNVVYTSLVHLESRDLVRESIKNGRKLFSIQSPDRLTAEFTQKAVIAKKVAQEIHQRAKVATSEVTLIQNDSEFDRQVVHLLQQLEQGDKAYIFGALTKGFMYDPSLEDGPTYHQMLRDKDLNLTILTSRSKKKLLKGKLKWFGKNDVNVRYLPVDIHDPELIITFPSINTLIYLICSDGGGDVAGVIFKHKGLTRSFGSLFTSFWKLYLR